MILYQAYGCKVCNFFEWYDEEESERQESERGKIIASLVMKIEQLKKSEKKLKMGLIISWALILLFLGSCIPKLM
jgi:hypothetical protein